MEGDDIPDTRVFVTGLPPNLTSEQLGAHFAMRYQVTDAVVVPGRRIGFVGFRNYTLAKNAVKYFDKSYIRMSKISVEMAKPVEVKRDGRSHAAPVSRKATRNPSQPASFDQSRRGSGGMVKDSVFRPYAHLHTASTSSKRKRDDDGQERQEDFPASVGTMQNSGSEPTRSVGTDMVASVPTTSSHGPHEAANVDGLDAGLKKLRKKSRKAEKDQRPDSDIGPQYGTSDTNTGKTERTISTAPQETDEVKTGMSQIVAALKDEEVAQSEEEATRKKKKKRKEKVAESEDHERGVHIEHTKGSPNSSERKMKKKERKHSKETKGGVEPLDDASGLGRENADLSQLDDTRTDSDWLRARTNRVLDLGDDADARTKGSAPTLAEGSDSSSSHSDQASERQKPAPSPVVQQDLEKSLANGRLFIRNLPYSANEVDIRILFSKYGKLHEVHIVQGTTASSNKGLAYVQYGDSNSAARALQQLDGASFQGRLLHILPALDKRPQKLDEYEISKLPLKKQREMKRKREAPSASFSWNSLYMNPDAVMSSVADRLGVAKADLLDPTSSDAAVKQAHAETHVIQETKSYLASKGVNIDAFKHPSRDDRTLLVKNFPFGVTTEDLRQLFEPHGHISRLIMPPSGTMAIVQYSEANEAAHALKQLAYKNLKGSVLFLERGPRGIFGEQAAREAKEVTALQPTHESGRIVDDAPANQIGTPSSTLFVRNLNFATTAARLKEVFEPLAGFVSARVKTKVDPKRPEEVLSMGYGFVDFRTNSQAQSAISVMNGFKLDNHELVVEASHKSTDAADERPRNDMGKAKKTKVVIKNLPFEASKKDVRSLFGAYGQLRSVRVPKKFDNSTRGFAFADFVSTKEAENAIAALTNTHLLGRRLVLEFASDDAIDPEDEIRAMEQRVNQQTNMVNMSKLTGSGRKRFTVEARDDEES